MSTLNGIAASSDIAIAKAYCLVEPDLSFGVKSIEDCNKEIERFRTALSKSARDLEKILEQAKAKLGADKAEIFEAHLLVLSDEEN